jgi:hypothetical protein
MRDHMGNDGGSRSFLSVSAPIVGRNEQIDNKIVHCDSPLENNLFAIRHPKNYGMRVLRFWAHTFGIVFVDGSARYSYMERLALLTLCGFCVVCTTRFALVIVNFLHLLVLLFSQVADFP